MVLLEECAGYRFGVGHEEFGLKFFKPLSDAHLAQHIAMLDIVHCADSRASFLLAVGPQYPRSWFLADPHSRVPRGRHARPFRGLLEYGGGGQLRPQRVLGVIIHSRE
jgi:hypothetical protein